MQAHWRQRLLAPLALAALGMAFGVLAVVDKLIGVVQRPLYLATVAYALLALLLAWAFVRGIHVRPARLLRLSVYTAFLFLNVLTAAYLFAWRLSDDPTPVFLEQRLARGDALLQAGEPDAAQLVYRDAFRQYPGSFPVLMRMGAISYQVGDYDRARKYYTRAVRTAPPSSRWRALSFLGQSYWKLEQPQQAIELYRQAHASGMPASQLPEWHYRLGWAYFDAQEFDAAITHYRAVTRDGGEYAAASYYNIACAEAQQLAAGRSKAGREALIDDALENLRRAWRATESVSDRDALRRGLVGRPEERDPDLAPLRSSARFAAFLREVRSE